MKCRECKKNIPGEEIYTDFYHCKHCNMTYADLEHKASTDYAALIEKMKRVSKQMEDLDEMDLKKCDSIMKEFIKLSKEFLERQDLPRMDL